MGQREIDAIHKISEAIELYVNDTLKDVLDQYDINVALNILMNVSTSMLAKSLILTEPDARDHVKLIANSLVSMKVGEGHAAVQSVIAINRAMVGALGDGSTCSPRPPKH